MKRIRLWKDRNERDIEQKRKKKDIKLMKAEAQVDRYRSKTKVAEKHGGRGVTLVFFQRPWRKRR